MGKKSSSGGKYTPGSPIERQRQRGEKKQRTRARRRRRTMVGVVVALLGVGAVATVIAVANGEDRRARDLSLVGTGVPAVVQVHDITCPVCTELRANVESIEGEFSDDELVIRVADIATDEGLTFARQHTSNRRVTLLFLDGDGDLVDEQVGLRSPQELREVFVEHSRR
ncbi:MAG: hypothetical protein WD492_05445 [Alkalispirochaeta sp.]